MNRETSIALHLARVMGKEHALHTYPDGRSQAVLLCYADGSKQMWWPENNLHQWAECVLWAVVHKVDPMLTHEVVSVVNQSTSRDLTLEHDNTRSGIQAATLEAIARATGWEESK